VNDGGEQPRVVAFGGGHGLAASLAALRRVTDRLTAVVTVADDGGSSGRMRRELDVLPPGDLRMALVALAGDDPWSQAWARLSQHRFGGSGTLNGHAVGNLLLAGLTATEGDPVSALALAGRLLGAAGRVLPLSTTPLDILAEVAGLDPADPSATATVGGQVAVATTAGQVMSVRLTPASPPACSQALEAVRSADWAVLGPGSWFTSVIPHLLVPEMSKALATTPARVLLALNLEPQRGETDGFSAENHLEVLAAHAPDLAVDVVLADPSSVGDEAGLRDAARSLGAELVVAPVAADAHQHDPQLLAAAYSDIFTTWKDRRDGDDRGR
jgi:uncharacterized cofD-like protein